MEGKKRTLDLREPPCQNPLVKLMKMDQLAEQTQMIHIGIDGYYGNDAFLTLQTMQLAKEKVRKVVIERFHVTDFSRVVWVCPLGSWMKCLPLFLIADGLGHHIEFIAPTGDIIATDQGLHISGKNGYTVKNSIELMDDRLNESESRSLCNVPPTFQIISDMLKKSKAFIHKTEAWKEQTEKLISLSEYAIVIPYYDPNTVRKHLWCA